MIEYIYSEDQEILVAQVVSDVFRGRGRYSLFTGPPGAGKSLLVDEIARITGIPVYKMTGAEIESANQLFYSMNAAKMVQGTGSVSISNLYQAVVDSNSHPVIIFFDEWDKTPERADAPALQVLDTGRSWFKGPYGGVIEGNANNMYFFGTSNNRRGYWEEFLRRLIVVEFPPPDKDKFKLILENQADPAPEGLLDYVVKMSIGFRDVIKREEYWPTPAEAIRLVNMLMQLETYADKKSTYYTILQWNFSKAIKSDNWFEIVKRLESKIGNVASALRTELGKA